eukprot:12870146-Ditylum_brightwellii.AAC.1
MVRTTRSESENLHVSSDSFTYLPTTQPPDNTSSHSKYGAEDEGSEDLAGSAKSGAEEDGSSKA